MDQPIPKKRLQKEKLTRIARLGALILLFTLAIATLASLFQSSVSSEMIQLSVVDRGKIDVTYPASGKVVPAFQQIINSPISSRILEVYKNSGDFVESGTPILKLDLQHVQVAYFNMLDQEKMMVLELEKLKLQNRSDLSAYELKINIQKMQLQNQNLALSNQRYLDSLGAGTAEQVRIAEMDYQVARLEYEEDLQEYENQCQLCRSNEKIQELKLSIHRKDLLLKKEMLEDAQIKAPADAILSFVNANIGSQVVEGEKIAMISDLSQFKIEGEIADHYRDKIAVGKSVIARIARDTLRGVVTNMNPVSESGMIGFSVQLDNSSHKILRSGMDCHLYIIDTTLPHVMRVKNGSFFQGTAEHEVYVLQGEELVRRDVVLGKNNYEYIEVISGLQAGEQVVITELEYTQKRIRLHK